MAVTVNVTQGSNCAWKALPVDVFLTVAGPADRTGDGTVTLSVSSNTGPARSGTANIAGKIVTVTQDAVAPTACVFSVTPTTVALPVAGGTATFLVKVAQGTNCAWTSTVAGTGITIRSGASGINDGTVIVDVAANPGVARTNGIIIAGQLVTISQPEAPGACVYSVNPTRFQVSSAAQTVAFDVTITTGTPENCSWSVATIGPPTLWMESMTRSGNTTHVILAMSQNTGAVDRTLSATAAGITVVVVQSGSIPSGPCNYDVTPLTIDAPAAGTSVAVTVSLVQGSVFSCTWSMVPNAPFITESSYTPVPETGGAKLTLAIAPNTGPARTGTVSIAGHTLTVTQAGAPTIAGR